MTVFGGFRGVARSADRSNACPKSGRLGYENDVCPASGELPGTDQKPLGGS